MFQELGRRIRQAGNNLIENSLAWLPTPVAEHLVNAQKEVLCAVKALIEEEIKWSDIHLARAKEKKLRAKQEASMAEEESLREDATSQADM